MFGEYFEGTYEFFHTPGNRFEPKVCGVEDIFRLIGEGWAVMPIERGTGQRDYQRYVGLGVTVALMKRQDFYAFRREYAEYVAGNERYFPKDYFKK